MKYDTIKEAAQAWVREFSAIPSSILEKLLKINPDELQEITPPAVGDRVYVYNPPAGETKEKSSGVKMICTPSNWMMAQPVFLNPVNLMFSMTISCLCGVLYGHSGILLTTGGLRNMVVCKPWRTVDFVSMSRKTMNTSLESTAPVMIFTVSIGFPCIKPVDCTGTRRKNKHATSSSL